MAKTRAGANKAPSPSSSGNTGTKKAKSKPPSKQADNTENNGSAGVLFDSLSEQDKLKFFKLFQNDLAKKKRTQQDIENEEICTRNKHLMDLENNGGTDNDGESSAPVGKHRRHQGLDKDEQALASALSKSGPQQNPGTDGNQEGNNNEDKGNNNDNDISPNGNGTNTDKDEEGGNDFQDLHDEDEDEDEGGSNVEDYGWNEILVNSVQKNKKVISRSAIQSRSSSLQPSVKSFSSSSSFSASSQSLPVQNRSKSGKVTEQNFPNPHVYQLAAASKLRMRSIMALETPFLSKTRQLRLEFLWKIVVDTAQKSGSPQMLKALHLASNNIKTKENLTTYTSYGCTNLANSIVGVARKAVFQHYKFDGSIGDIAGDVKWLLEDSHFAFDDLNIKERSFNINKLFLNPFIATVIETQWVPSSRSKLDGEATAWLMEKKTVPSVMILLAVTAIEHAIKEWAGGVKPMAPIQYSEASAHQSYLNHKKTWDNAAKNTTVWEKWVCKTTFKAISKNFHSFGETSSPVGNLNFAEMDCIAKEAMEADD